jgi:hypothetical protein
MYVLRFMKDTLLNLAEKFCELQRILRHYVQLVQLNISQVPY